MMRLSDYGGVNGETKEERCEGKTKAKQNRGGSGKTMDEGKRKGPTEVC